jgi:hypothetical protein
MESGDTLTSSPRSLKTRTPEILRHRAVLHEGRVRDLATEQALERQQQYQRKHQRLGLTREQEDAYPALCQHLALHDGWPPTVSRKSKARVRQLDALYDAYGPLVLLRLALPELDELPVYSPAMSRSARQVTAERLNSLLVRPVYTADVQRGADFGTHSHHCTPLSFLAEPYQQLVNAAPHGPCAGYELSDQAAHGAVMLNAAIDRRKVASYVTRHPDGRLDDSTTALYLAALEDELNRKAQGGPVVRLGWTKNVIPLLGSSTKRPTHPATTTKAAKPASNAVTSLNHQSKVVAAARSANEPASPTVKRPGGREGRQEGTGSAAERAGDRSQQ